MEPLSNTTTGAGAGAVITAALSTLTPPQLSSFTATISAVFHHHHHRLAALLSSHTLFSLSLHHLHSLSLHHKSLLIARHLLSLLAHLLRPPYSAAISRSDLDAVLLLLLLCEVQRYAPNLLLTSSKLDWRGSLSGYFSGRIMTFSGGMEFSGSETLMKYIGLVTKCRNFVGVMDFRDGKEKKVVAAARTVVVALPSVVVERGGKQCVVCKEEMEKGVRDVCELPCDHRFHWKCILPWLEKRNTCPYCRHRLPTDDVYGELERQWEVLVKMGGGG